jgi:DNA-3-methyladenine glycosylase II
VDPVLADVVARVGPCTLRAPRRRDDFAALARAIVFQQLAGAAAETIHGRFAALFGGTPTPAAVLACDVARLRAAGLSGAKAAAVADLARATTGPAGVPAAVAVVRRRGTARGARHRAVDRADIPDVPPRPSRRVAVSDLGLPAVRRLPQAPRPDAGDPRDGRARRPWRSVAVASGARWRAPRRRTAGPIRRASTGVVAPPSTGSIGGCGRGTATRRPASRAGRRQQAGGAIRNRASTVITREADPSSVNSPFCASEKPA